ncbi:hypothetical protein D3C87_1732850 [compost metagenome]
MWTTTKICEVTLLIESNTAIFKAINQLQFILISFFSKILDCVSFSNIRAFIFLFRFSQFDHFLLYFIKVVRRKLVIAEINIIVKTRFYRRTYT